MIDREERLREIRAKHLHGSDLPYCFADERFLLAELAAAERERDAAKTEVERLRTLALEGLAEIRRDFEGGA